MPQLLPHDPLPDRHGPRHGPQSHSGQASISAWSSCCRQHARKAPITKPSSQRRRAIPGPGCAALASILQPDNPGAPSVCAVGTILQAQRNGRLRSIVADTLKCPASPAASRMNDSSCELPATTRSSAATSASPLNRASPKIAARRATGKKNPFAFRRNFQQRRHRARIDNHAQRPNRLHARLRDRVANRHNQRLNRPRIPQLCQARRRSTHHEHHGQLTRRRLRVNRLLLLRMDG